MATFYYNTDGSISNVNQGGPDVAFIGNIQLQTVKASDMRRFAAIIYAESSFWGLVQQIAPANPYLEMQRETFAMAYTMFNYTMAKKRKTGKYGFFDLLYDEKYVHGIKSRDFTEFMEGNPKDLRRSQAVVMASMRLFLGPQYQRDMQDVIQRLNGALYWDGNDLFRRFKAHWRGVNGFVLSDPAHGAIYQNVTSISGTQVISTTPATREYIVNQGIQYVYLSTTTFAGSIFFKFHPQGEKLGV